MKVQILKTRNKFQISCGYNAKILNVIRRIKKRYYDKVNKTWYLPIEEYQDFINVFSTDPEFEIEVKDLKPVVFIKPIGDKISVKFSQFIEEFKKYMEFSGRHYNPLERHIIMSMEHKDGIVALSKELGYEVITEGITTI